MIDGLTIWVVPVLSGIFFLLALYSTALMFEWWFAAKSDVAPLRLVQKVAIVWTLFAWTQGLFGS